MIYVIFVFIGAVGQLETIWAFGLALFGIMAIPNLITLLLKSKEIFAMTEEAHQIRNNNKNQSAE
ncbi:MAG: sodium:alanine symporter family protein [Emcibacteraceae bacterium]|nr:sodium:alanine symporter family protein [Emcibacteraceae bacterium]